MLKVKVKKRLLNKREQAIGMLKNKRLDFFIDAEVDIENFLENRSDKEHFEYKPINHLQLNLYMCFVTNEKGIRLRKIFDEGMVALLKSGKLKKLFNQWEWDIFPFEKHQ